MADTPADSYQIGQQVGGHTIVDRVYSNTYGWLNLLDNGAVYQGAGAPQPIPGSYLSVAAGAANPTAEAAAHGTFGLGGIDVTAGGGFIETNTGGEQYRFGAMTAPPALPPASPFSPTQQSAWDYLRGVLQQFDLGSLTTFVQNEIVGGASQDQVALDIFNTPEFNARFPAIKMRQQSGLAPITPAEYVSLERSYEDQMRAAGLPTSYWNDRSNFTNLIAADVSPSELNSRIQDGYIAAQQAPPEVRQQLANLYGITDGHLAAFFLDPNNALDAIKRDVQAASIAGAAQQAQFGQLSRTQAENVASHGITADQARTGFDELFRMRQLSGTLPGQAQTALNPDQLLGAEFGNDAATRELLKQRGQQQTAMFAGGARFATSSKGVEGLATANR